MRFIPYGRQDIAAEDVDAVVRVLKSDFLTQGPAIEEFEQAVCLETGAGFAVACNNGTAALHLAALAADIKPGDRVIVPAITFVASANCASYNGAEIIFADIDAATLTVCPFACRKLLSEARAAGRPIKAVVTVDLAGNPCDMQAFAALKKEFGFVWIQDACHSIGASWEDSHGIRWKVGEFPQVDLTVFSFHPVKHITTGEGGMIVTHCHQYAQVMRLFRTHGISKAAGDFVNRAEAFADDGSANPWYYEMQKLGFNYRLTDIQAALGTSQLKRLGKFIVRRQEIAAAYRTQLANVQALRFPVADEGVSHAFHLAIVLIDFAALAKSRSQVMQALKDKGIGTQVHYIPVPMMPFYSADHDLAAVPKSVAYYRQALSLPCFSSLTNAEVLRVCEAVKEILS